MVADLITDLDKIQYVSSKIGDGDAIAGQVTTWYECPNEACPLMKKCSKRIPEDEKRNHTRSKAPGCGKLVRNTADECKAIEHAIFDTIAKAFQSNEAIKKTKASIDLAGDKIRQLTIRRHGKNRESVPTVSSVKPSEVGKRKKSVITKAKLKSLTTYVKTLVNALLAEWMDALIETDKRDNLLGSLLQDEGQRKALIELLQKYRIGQTRVQELGTHLVQVRRRRLLPRSLSHDSVENEDDSGELTRRLLSPHFRRLLELRDPSYQHSLLKRLRKNQSNEKQRQKQQLNQ